jgi:putative endonuclease
MSKKWFLYILKCSDESLYTGITNNLEKRVAVHNAKKGAKSLKGKLPVELVYFEEYNNRSEASKREYEVKQMKREEKWCLVNSV